MGLDFQSPSLDRLRRNMQKIGKGGATSTIKTSSPITGGSTVGLAFATSTGLGLIGGKALGILFSDASIAATSTGLHVVESSTGGISTSAAGIGLLLADSTLSLSSSGVKVGTLTSTNLPADVAYTDKANTFTAQQTIKAILGTDSGNGTFEITSNVGVLRFGGAATISPTLSGDFQVWAAGTGFPAVYISGGPTSIIFRAGTGLVTVFSIATTGNPTFTAFSNTTVALTVKGAALQSSDLQQWTDSTPTAVLRIDAKGHPVGAGSTPGIAAGTGAGTGPTLSISGHDLAGQITLTTGAGPVASAVICTVTFAGAFAAAPIVLFSPANAAAAALSGLGSIYVTATGSTFVFNADTTALAAATQYIWNYHVLG